MRTFRHYRQCLWFQLMRFLWRSYIISISRTVLLIPVYTISLVLASSLPLATFPDDQESTRNAKIIFLFLEQVSAWAIIFYASCTLLLAPKLGQTRTWSKSKCPFNWPSSHRHVGTSPLPVTACPLLSYVNLLNEDSLYDTYGVRINWVLHCRHSQALFYI